MNRKNKEVRSVGKVTPLLKQSPPMMNINRGSLSGCLSQCIAQKNKWIIARNRILVSLCTMSLMVSTLPDLSLSFRVILTLPSHSFILYWSTPSSNARILCCVRNQFHKKEVEEITFGIRFSNSGIAGLNLCVSMVGSPNTSSCSL